MEIIIIKTEKNASIFNYVLKKIEDKKIITSYIQEGKNLKDIEIQRNIKFVNPI
jgi:hypothetical protein